MTTVFDHVAIAIEGLDPRSREIDRLAGRLRRVAGVHLVQLDRLTDTIYVRFDPHHCSSAVLTRTMHTAGFREARVA